MSVEIKAITVITGREVDAVNRLLPQVDPSAVPLSLERLQHIATREGNTLLAAHFDGKIVGMLTLVLFPIPTGTRAWIEDVVVDESARGRGAGEALIREAIGLAKAANACTTDLSCRPSREAAHRLYLRMGFKQRDTCMYRLTDDSSSKGPARGQETSSVRVTTTKE